MADLGVGARTNRILREHNVKVHAAARGANDKLVIGMTVLLENNHNCRKVGISVVVKAGSRRHHDKGNNIGVENFGSRQFLCLRSLKKPN